MAGKHEWRFFRAGGFDQVRIETGADVLALGELDQKLWVALSCPVRGIEFDEHTLALLDTDHDGQVRAPEVLAAIEWAAVLLKDADLLAQGAAALPLSAINDGTDDGRKLLAAARHILAGLGRPDAEAVSTADTTDTQKLMQALRCNGDGVIVPDEVEDDALAALARDVAATCGSVADRSGKAGITADLVKQFFEEANAYMDWRARGEGDAAILFLGEATLAAAERWRVVRAKVDDYFTRCQLAEYDGRAAQPLSRSVEDYQRLAAQELNAATAELAAFPLAQVAPGQPLPLVQGVNPAWASALAGLRDEVVQPLLGARTALAQGEWRQICDRFAAVDGWLADKPASRVEPLGAARLREVLDGGEVALQALIAEDAALADEVAAIASVDRLVHYVRDLGELLNNFVSFRSFFTGAGKATFQAGELFLDGRSCELCVKVDDIGKHAALANLSRVYLVYCECTRGGQKMNIAAAFTAGDSDQLMVGRNGVFYDRKGQDWNATIVRILEHPISIRQAFWAPFKRAGKMVGEQIQKFAAAKSQAAEAKMVTSALEAGKKPDEAAKPPPFDVGKFAGVFAAIGLAIGALGTALASIVTGILGLKWWQMPLVFVGALLAVSGPSMLIAWFKLKQRNLGPILDANGWAVNARARINIPFGASLTAVAKLPEGASTLQLIDPFAEKKRLWPYYLALLLAVLGGWLWWRYGR